MLGKEDILSKTDLKKEPVKIPEWGGEVFVSEMSADARDKWEQCLVGAGGKSNLHNARAKIVVATVVDDKGDPIFTEDDIESVGKLSSVALERICKIAMDLNGITDVALKDAVKN